MGCKASVCLSQEVVRSSVFAVKLSSITPVIQGIKHARIKQREMHAYNHLRLPPVPLKVTYTYLVSPQGTVLSHKRKVQGKASALCCFTLVICAACVCRGVVEVAALLGFIQRGLCSSSAVWAIGDQVVAAIKDKPGPATRRNQRPTGCDTWREHRHRNVDR